MSEIVNRLPIPSMVKLDVLAVYNLIAEAESRVHGVSVQQIHFHEVGTMDAVADITAVCLLMREIRARSGDRVPRLTWEAARSGAPTAFSPCPHRLRPCFSRECPFRPGMFRVSCVPPPARRC